MNSAQGAKSADVRMRRLAIASCLAPQNRLCAAALTETKDHEPQRAWLSVPALR
jgi:hypothetical protein